MLNKKLRVAWERTAHTVCQQKETCVVEWSWPWAEPATRVVRLSLPCGRAWGLSLCGVAKFAWHDLQTLNHERVQTSPTVWDISVGVDSPPSSVCVQCMLWYTDNNLHCYDIHSQSNYFSLPWRLMCFPVTGANTVPNSCAVVQSVGEGCRDWTDRCASAIWTCSS